MTEIGVKRLPAGDGEKYSAERDQPDTTVFEQKLHPIERVDRE